jgi:hypothetical protein
VRLDLFSTPVWHIPVEEDHPGDALDWALSFEKENDVSVSNRGGFQSEGFQSFDHFPYLNYLSQKLDFLPHFSAFNWWININRMGDYNVAHTHPLMDLSVIWYLTNTSSGALSLINSFQHTRYGLNECFGIDNEYCFECNAGDILIFPADVMHYVEPNTSESPRVSVALNLRLM